MRFLYRHPRQPSAAVLLSIVLPVYGVEDLLEQCLDSILDQGVDGLEVVAVDDSSPDGSGAILDRYAARHHRLRVVRLPDNRGLGGAREAGLAEATGAYVWYVDSDDWLAEGAVAAVVERLRADDPDVLLLGHEKVFPDGRTERHPGEATLSSLASSEPFTAARRPEVFGIFPCAFNRVTRRALIDRLGFTHPKGYYEDLPVTIPTLVAADRVVADDQVRVHYRQRAGSILHSRGERHLEVLGQYDLLWKRLASLGDVAPPVEAAVFEAMALHLFSLIGSGRLGGQRAPFLDGASALARQHRPDGYRYPSGVDGLRIRLLTAGRLTPILALRAVYQAAARFRR